MTPKAHVEAALVILDLADDPLLRDAIRALVDRGTPRKVGDSAKKYVENSYAAYLTLFQNGDKSPPYGLRYFDFDAA